MLGLGWKTGIYPMSVSLHSMLRLFLTDLCGHQHARFHESLENECLVVCMSLLVGGPTKGHKKALKELTP